MGSSCDVSGAAHLPDHVASYFDGLPNAEAATALRLEGFAPSVKHRKEALAALMKPFGPVALLDEAAIARALAQRARRSSRSPRRRRARGRCGASRPRPGGATRSPPPSRRRRRCSTTGPAGSSGWRCRLPTSPTPASIRAAVESVGGHATLVRAPAAVRAAVDVFEPQEAALAALSKRVKESFDPKGVLNPGRMWAGV